MSRVLGFLFGVSLFSNSCREIRDKEKNSVSLVLHEWLQLVLLGKKKKKKRQGSLQIGLQSKNPKKKGKFLPLTQNQPSKHETQNLHCVGHSH